MQVLKYLKKIKNLKRKFNLRIQSLIAIVMSTYYAQSQIQVDKSEINLAISSCSLYYEVEYE